MHSTTVRANGVDMITPSGYRDLQRELEQLRTEDLPRAQQRMRHARADGDLTDNPGLVSIVEDLARVEYRIAFMAEQLAACRVVTIESDERAEIGTHVVVLDLTSHITMNFMLVGPLEADADLGHLSTESPIGSAIHGLQVGEVGTADTPRGARRMRLEHVSLTDPASPKA